MDDNNLLMIVLAFVVGFMLQGMMKNMCGGRLVEGNMMAGNGGINDKCQFSTHCQRGLYCKGGFSSCLGTGPCGVCAEDDAPGFKGYHPGNPWSNNSSDYLEYIFRSARDTTTDK